MKLGICCVYFYGPDSHWLLKLQLSYIEQTLQGYDYTIYAAANRLLSEYLPSLKAHPRVTIVPLPVHRGTHPGQEHAFYLDRLLLVAAEDGCTHLATLDADSFPVLPGWPHELIGRMGTSRLAAVLRSENLDTCLPHPCGYFMQRSLLLERRPCLYPDVEVSKSDDFQNFLRETGQRIDTGIGYAYTLWKSREHWFPLQRSNKRNLHYLMAGIYGNIILPSWRLLAPTNLLCRQHSMGTASR